MSQKLGSVCERCQGDGYVDAEAEGLPEDGYEGLALCPYVDVEAGVECEEGLIVPLGGTPNRFGVW